MARPEYHSRAGTAWKPGYVPVMGEDVFGNVQIFDMPEGHFRCKRCNEVVRLDMRGYAACWNCGRIYNDEGDVDKGMSNREKKRRLEKLKYDCRHTRP